MELDAVIEALAPDVRVSDRDEGGAWLDVHPAAQPIRVENTPAGFSFHAHTATAGPGYHRFVRILAERLADACAVRWEEEPDRLADASLEEAFLERLQDAAKEIARLADGGYDGFSLLLPSGYAYRHRGLVATPLGPRSERWAREVAERPDRGVDVFSYWGDERGAAHLVQRARVSMWVDVRWRAPLIAKERALLDEVASLHERAFGLDGDADIPWAEQSEIFTLLGEQSLRATRAHIRAGSAGRAERIGYRRGPVAVEPSGGWWIDIDGAFAERVEERGTWVAWDATRALWFSSMIVSDARGRPTDTAATLESLPPLADGGERLLLERDEIRGVARLTTDRRAGAGRESERVYRLEAHAAQGEHAAIGTLVFRDETDRDWALDTWSSLRRGLPPPLGD